MKIFKRSFVKFTAIISLALIGFAGLAYAAGGGSSDYKMKHPHWHFKGAFGTFDRAAAQRGYQVYREVCAACHSLNHVSFRHLGDKGAPFFDEKYPNPNDNPLVKAFAADWTIADIDTDSGDVIDRPGITADKFPPIFANSAAAAAANGGAIPPDLSSIVAARGGGADYIYNLLTAYNLTPPEGYELSPGTHYNPVMEGGAIAMAPPLFDDLVEYGDGTAATIDQMALDVTEFLAWSSDPKMEQRKFIGFGTMIFLLILSILLFFSYKEVWRDVEH